MEPNLEKKQWLDQYIFSHVMPAAGSVSLTGIIEYFEFHPEFWEHRVRYLETYTRIMKFVPLDFEMRIGETGALSGTSSYLKSQGYNIEALGGDFRYRIKAESCVFDRVISLEVFEHIKDHNSINHDEIVNFNFSGARSYIREMYRIIKPGGYLVLSTPNPCSLICLTRLLKGEQPLFFVDHVREYSWDEVIRMMEDEGFQLKHFETLWTCFFLDKDVGIREQALKKYFSDLGASPENRGDISFYIFAKE